MNVSMVRRDYNDGGEFYQIFVGFNYYGHGLERVDAGILLKREEYEIKDLTDAEAIELARTRFKGLI